MLYLSICIPTYNRRYNLEKAIESIIFQESFQKNEVEIVVSDNASDDGTEELMKNYIKSIKNIRYFRNETNLGVNVNIYNALNLGIGKYRKVCNDSYIFINKALDFMVEYIKANIENRPFLVFGNKNVHLKPGSFKQLECLDEFVKINSYFLTDDALLGFWEEELSIVKNEDCSTWFWSIKAMFKIIIEKKSIIITSRELFIVSPVQGKDLTYGLIKVFFYEYLKCYKPYIGKEITLRTFKNEKSRLLYRFFLQWFVNKETLTKFRYSIDDTISGLQKAYCSNLTLFIIVLRLLIIKFRLRRYLKNILLKH